MIAVSSYSSLPEIKLPDSIADQLLKHKIGDVIKLRGTFLVKEISEGGVRIEIDGLHTNIGKRHA